MDSGVADILFDLKRRETRAYAHIFSRGLVSELSALGRLNHNPERSAGFVVLKAPDFPSVLVELGYLSNPRDVVNMVSPDWRQRDGDGDGRGGQAVLRAERQSQRGRREILRDAGGLRRPSRAFSGRSAIHSFAAVATDRPFWPRRDS